MKIKELGYFFICATLISAQSVFAQDPFGPVGPPGIGSSTSDPFAFSASRTVGTITSAEIRAQNVLNDARALEQHYQGFVNAGQLDSVPADVRQAVAQAETSLNTIRETKAIATSRLNEYSALENGTTQNYQEALAQAQATNPAAYQQLSNLGEDGYYQLAGEERLRALAQAQREIEGLAQGAQDNLNTAQSRLDTQQSELAADEEAIKQNELAGITQGLSIPDISPPVNFTPGAEGNIGTSVTTPADQMNDLVLRWGVCRLYRSVEGGMGGLFATIAGVIAIVMAVVGAFKAAWGFMLVSVGAFILRSLVSLFYGGDFNQCVGNGGLDAIDRNVTPVVDTSGIA